MSAPAPVAAEMVELECELCGETVTGKARGSGSATWKLGTHKRIKHGIQGQGRRKKGQPRLAEHEAHPVIAAAREAAADVGIGKKGAPNADELAAGLGKLLHIVTMSGAAFAATTDPTIPHGPEGNPDREFLVETLTLELPAAVGVMSPIGRMFHTTPINRRFGRGLVDNVDVAGSLFDLAMLLREWRAYFALRSSRIAQAAEQGPRLSMAPAPTVEQAAPVVPVTSANGWHPGAMTEGRVIGADDLRGRAS